MTEIKKDLIPPPDKQQWMAHYWEAKATNQRTRPLTIEALAARVEELEIEIVRRRKLGLPLHGLEQEQIWRQRQIEQRQLKE
jgi:hypothetical protein